MDDYHRLLYMQQLYRQQFYVPQTQPTQAAPASMPDQSQVPPQAPQVQTQVPPQEAPSTHAEAGTEPDAVDDKEEKLEAKCPEFDVAATHALIMLWAERREELLTARTQGPIYEQIAECKWS